MTDDTVRPDDSVVATNHAGYGGETDSGAFEIFVAMKSVESVEELVGVGHVETGTIVADKPSILFFVPAELDERVRELGGELGGIAEEVFEGDADELRVALDFESGFNLEVNNAVAGFGWEGADDGFGEGGKVDGLAGEIGAGDAGELEEGVDKLSHALDAGADTLNVVAASSVDGVGVVFREGEREAVYGAKRSAQVVGDGVGEGFELAVGGFELGSALANALFEGGVENSNFGGVLFDFDA